MSETGKISSRSKSTPHDKDEEGPATKSKVDGLLPTLS